MQSEFIKARDRAFGLVVGFMLGLLVTLPIWGIPFGFLVAAIGGTLGR